MLDEAVWTAGDLMTRDVIVVQPNTSLLDAVRMLVKHRISGMPVVDDSAIVGMFAECDLVRWHEGYTERQTRWLNMLADGYSVAPDFLAVIQEQHRKVKTVMSPGAVTVTEDTPAREIAHLMNRHNVRRVVVMREGQLVGIVAQSDLVRALASKLAEVSLPPSY